VPTGKVKWFNGAKGFGFLVIEGGGDVFVHQSAVERSDYGPLCDGQPVEFEIGPGPKGTQALAVRSMGPPPRAVRRRIGPSPPLTETAGTAGSVDGNDATDERILELRAE
jgi:cold shock protein